MTGIVDEYKELHDNTDADILAMQVGDFYEFFNEDAHRVAEELDLQISQKSSQGSSYPMAGVPVNELTPYLKRLVERGYRVAVADQYETNGGHAREISKVVTPGTILETLDPSAHYLASIVIGEDEYGIAFVEVSVGNFYVTQVTDREELLSELYRFEPAEILLGPTLRNHEDFVETIKQQLDTQISNYDDDAFGPMKALHRTRDHFGEETLESLNIAETSPTVQAIGSVISYIDDTGTGVLESLTRLQTYETSENVTLDATTQRNLELTETMYGDSEGSLLETINHTQTSSGYRLLREWIQRPLQNKETLRQRHQCVEALTKAPLERDKIQEQLADGYDLHRLTSKIVQGSADATDLKRLHQTLQTFPRIQEIIRSNPELSNVPLHELVQTHDEDVLQSISSELASALVEDPPQTIKEGEIFQQGYDDELDTILEEYTDLQQWFDTLAEEEQQKYNITHLHIDRNQTDGFYIQVGNSETDKVPEKYREIKSLKNSTRYTTDQLDEREREFLRLEKRREEHEYKLFIDLRERISEHAQLLQSVASILAEIDVYQNFAVHAVNNDWIRPEITEGDELSIIAGRHPVVEQQTEFVPNDVKFGSDKRFLIVTGPNMSGKSTYMRQIALIVLLTQIGSFIPADEATIGLVDGIFTRVGALDELAQGRSTFMVEMQELANILHSSTEQSLVLLDEVGRGTATFDGISIAWATTEYLHNEIKAKTLFATHYHELTTLGDYLDGVANVHVEVSEDNGDIRFLRQIQSGPTDRSYGIHVAELAGVPDPVLNRASEVLNRLRNEKAIEMRGDSSSTTQAVFDLDSQTFKKERQSINDQIDSEIIEELKELNIDQLTPIEALEQLDTWDQKLENNE